MTPPSKPKKKLNPITLENRRRERLEKDIANWIYSGGVGSKVERGDERAHMWAFHGVIGMIRAYVEDHPCTKCCLEESNL